MGVNMISKTLINHRKNRDKILKRLDEIEKKELDLVDLAYREIEAIIAVGDTVNLCDSEQVANFKKLKDSAASTVNLMTKLGVYVGAKRGDIRVNMRVSEEPTSEMKLAEDIVSRARERLANGRAVH